MKNREQHKLMEILILLFIFVTFFSLYVPLLDIFSIESRQILLSFRRKAHCNKRWLFNLQRWKENNERVLWNLCLHKISSFSLPLFLFGSSFAALSFIHSTYILQEYTFCKNGIHLKSFLLSFLRHCVSCSFLFISFSFFSSCFFSLFLVVALCCIVLCGKLVQMAFYLILTENYGKAHLVFSSRDVKSISKASKRIQHSIH